MRRSPLAPLLVFFLAAFAIGCTQSGGGGTVTSAFKDDFNRDSLGPDWLDTGGSYRLENGVLKVEGAKNHPLWLKRTLPRDVKIELDAWSDSPDGDIKFEVFGDGTSYALTPSYTATSYVIVLGGWKNSKSIIARMEEHGGDRQVRTDLRVEPGRKYHFTVTRKGNLLAWKLDGQPFLDLNDDAPLAGPGHDHFGFNNWATPLSFDNLVIEPL